MAPELRITQDTQDTLRHQIYCKYKMYTKRLNDDRKIMSGCKTHKNDARRPHRTKKLFLDCSVQQDSNFKTGKLQSTAITEPLDKNKGLNFPPDRAEYEVLRTSLSSLAIKHGICSIRQGKHDGTCAQSECDEGTQRDALLSKLYLARLQQKRMRSQLTVAIAIPGGSIFESKLTLEDM